MPCARDAHQSQQPPPTPDPGGPHHAHQLWAIAIAMLIFSVLSATAAVKSEGDLEADACTHYIYARFALQEPHLLTNVWGRPFCTAIYCIPAVLGGRLGARLMALAMSLIIALVCWRIAVGQRYRWPALATIFLLGQPILFLHSFSQLTEIPFAMLLALAFWAYQRQRWLLMSVLVSLMPTARPEGFGFVLLAAAGLLLHRRWWLLPVLVLPLPLWSLIGWYQFGAEQPWYLKWWMWLIEQWPYAAESLYDRGTIFYFLGVLPAVVSPLVFPAVGLGVWRSLAWPAPPTEKAQPPAQGTGSGVRTLWYRRGAGHGAQTPWYWIAAQRLGRGFLADHHGRCQALIAIIPLTVLLVHSTLYATGKMASAGEPRYLLTAAAMWALLAARGWEWAFTQFNWRFPLRWAGAAVLLPVLANVYYPVIPIKLTADSYRAMEVAQWYQLTPLREAYPLLTATNPGISYYVDVSPSDPRRCAEYKRENIIKGLNGVLLIWDPIYGLYNSDNRRSMDVSEILACGWVPVHRFSGRPTTVPATAPVDPADRVNDWIVFLSPRDAAGRPTPQSLRIELGIPAAPAPPLE